MLISLVIPVFALLVIGGIIWMIIEGIVHISKKNKAIDNFFNKVNKVSETYKFGYSPYQCVKVKRPYNSPFTVQGF